MNDFDARLVTKLERFDAAVPALRAPVCVAPPRPTVGSPKRRRMIVLLVAATVVLASAGAFVASGAQIPPPPAERAQEAADEAGVLDDFGTTMSGLCLSEPEAKTLVRQRLDALGLSNWTVRSDDRVSQARCIGAAPAGNADVLLMPSMGGDVGDAVQRISADLMSRCVTAGEAVALVRSTLIGLGRADPDVRIGPPRGIPVADAGAYVKHMADGCAVYGGAQFDEVGRYTWYVSTH